MIVKVKLFAILRDMLPAGTDGHEVDVDVPDGATPLDVIRRLEIPEELAHLVMVNGFHLLRDDLRTRALQVGDVLSIFPPIAGG